MTDIAESMDISSILRGCLAGDQSAIESMVRHFETGVFRLALSVVDDPLEASEIAQETFLATLRSLRSYEEKSSFKAWLYTIALNLSRSHLRKRMALKRLRSVLAIGLQLETRNQVSPEERAIQNETDDAVWNALQRLDEKHRIPMILRYYQECSVMEIAQIMNVNEGTIHSRLHHARERLRGELKDWVSEDVT